jgi:hypothetical protein
MDTENGPDMEIFPRIIAKTDKRCVFLTDGKPVPLSLILPPQKCPYEFYGTEVQCPPLLNAYVDLKFGQEWREQPFIQQEESSPDWSLSIQKNVVTNSSDLRSKLAWLRRWHCPTL